jgi:hypothetical protein
LEFHVFVLDFVDCGSWLESGRVPLVLVPWMDLQKMPNWSISFAAS